MERFYHKIMPRAMSECLGQSDPDSENGGGQGDETIQNELIHQEIKKDNVEKVQELVNTMNEDEKLDFLIPKLKCVVPVLLAIEYNSMECLRYLLECHRKCMDCGFKVKGRDQTDGFVDQVNRNACHYVAMRGREGEQFEAANILKEYPSILTHIVNNKDDIGFTPLFTAVKRNNVTVAKLLVQSGAHFDNIIKDQSPINIAVTNGQVEVLQEMIKMHEKSKPKSLPELFTNAELFGEGHTIFYPAAASGSDEIFCILFEKMGENAETNLKKEMCHHKDCKLFIKHISSSGMMCAMKKLIELKKKTSDKKPPDKKPPDKKPPDKKPPDKKVVKTATCLMWAAKFHRREMVEFILENMSEIVNMEDENGRNVFHYAAEAAEPYVLQHLMDKYRQLCNHKDKEGCSPLHRAALVGKSENVKKLLLEDNIEMSDDSIFHCQVCVKTIRPEMLKYILDTYEGSKKINLVDLFEIQNKQKRTPLQEAAYAGRIDILELYLANPPLEKRASIQLPRKDLNWTLLHFAVAGKSLPMVQFLVEKGMVNSRSDNDETPAVIAAEHGSAEILKYLLEKGAKVFGEYQKENLLDCVTRCPCVQDGVNTALVIIKSCDKEGIDLLEKLMNDSKSNADGIMFKLVKEMPIVANEILDRCISFDNVNSGEVRTVTYNFFPLQSQVQDGRLEALNSMIKYHRNCCLRHPVVAKFLEQKWNNSSAKWCYIMNIVLYAIFLFSITTYICLQARGSNKMMSPVLVRLSMVSVVVVLLNMLKEIAQMIFRYKQYFFTLNNYLEWLMYVSALVYVSPPIEDKTVRQIQAGAIAVLLAWINFIWFFKRVSPVGIYIIMWKKILMSLMKVLPIVFLFIFAFSMAFFLLMGKDVGFDYIPIALLSTSVMMVGEVNYREVFLDNEKGPHVVLQRIILLFFLIGISIALMNLFVGLAVGETAETIKRAKDEKRFDKASLIVALQHSFLHIPWITLSRTEDHLVDHLVEKKRQPWYGFVIKPWGSVFEDSELDDVDEDNAKILSGLERVDEDNAMILSRLERVESSIIPLNKALKGVEASIIRLTKALENADGDRSEVKIESDENGFDDAV